MSKELFLQDKYKLWTSGAFMRKWQSLFFYLNLLTLFPCLNIRAQHVLIPAEGQKNVPYWSCHAWYPSYPSLRCHSFEGFKFVLSLNMLYHGYFKPFIYDHQCSLHNPRTRNRLNKCTLKANSLQIPPNHRYVDLHGTTVITGSLYLHK